MKSSLCSLLAATVLVPAALVFTGCSKQDNSNASQVVQDIKTTAVDTWDSIKSYTYEKRVEFTDAMSRMSDSMDKKVADLKAQGKSVPDYDDAKADLKKSLNDLSNATADTWDAAKANVDKAWARVKADYDKATSSS